MTLCRRHDHFDVTTCACASTDTVDLIDHHLTEGVTATTRSHCCRNNSTTVNNQRNTTTNAIAFDGHVFISAVVITSTRGCDNNSIDLTTDCVGHHSGVTQHRHVFVGEEFQHLTHRDRIHILPTITVSSGNNRS